MRCKAIKNGKPVGSEHDEQSAFFDWVRVMRNVDPRFWGIFAVPNEQKLGGNDPEARMRVIAWLEKQGMLKGAPDIVGLIPNKSFHGFAIEAKAAGKKPKKEQYEIGDRLIANGFCWVYLCSGEAMIQFVCDYLGMKHAV